MYKLYLENDESVQHLCLLYCDAKSFLWNMFFGWRKTNRHGMYFRFTEKQHKRIMFSAKILFDYEIIQGM